MELNERAVGVAEVRLVPDEDTPTDIVVSGPCPNCRAEFVHVEPVFLIRGVRAQDVEVICDCGYQHEGAPDGETGCGRSWTLTVEWGVP